MDQRQYSQHKPVFNSAVNTTLLLNGMLRRRCCRTPAPAAVDRYVLPVGRSAANPPHAAAAVEQTDGRTDVRTPDRYVDPAAHTMRAVSIRCMTVYQFLNLRRKKTARVMRASTTVVEISSHRTRRNVWKLIRSCERKKNKRRTFLAIYRVRYSYEIYQNTAYRRTTLNMMLLQSRTRDGQNKRLDSPVHRKC